MILVCLVYKHPNSGEALIFLEYCAYLKGTKKWRKDKKRVPKIILSIFLVPLSFLKVMNRCLEYVLYAHGFSPWQTTNCKNRLLKCYFWQVQLMLGCHYFLRNLLPKSARKCLACHAP